MGRFRSFATEEDEQQGIDMSPLIDCVFILLIFFIVTTTFVEETGVEVDKPQAASAARLEKTSILIALTSKGEVVYGGRQIGISDRHRCVDGSTVGCAQRICDATHELLVGGDVVEQVESGWEIGHRYSSTDASDHHTRRQPVRGGHRVTGGVAGPPRRADEVVECVGIG